MAMNGRKRKPSKLRELEGNRGHRPIPKNEPQPTGVPTCPTHLDTVAKREWTRVGKQLIAMGLLTSVDRAALAAYCTAYSHWCAAEKQIQKFGLVVKSPVSGVPIPNPYVAIAYKALDSIRKFGTEFGLTPASRARLAGTAGEQQTDAFEDFMAGIGGEDIVNDLNPIKLQ